MTAPLRPQAETLQRTRGGITYETRAGDGPVIVFLHGIGSSATGFETLFERLPPAYGLIAWNAPGYGGSVPLAADWPVAEDYAEALLGFLDDLAVERCVLVGHSLGTLMGAAFAKAHPTRVTQLILAASAQGYGVPVGDPLPEKAAKRIEDLATLGPQEFARTRAANLVHAPVTAPEIVAQVQANMAQVDPSGYAQAVRMLASGDLAGLMSDVTTPTDFITGAQDKVTPRPQTQAAAEAWAKTNSRTPRILDIRSAGHAIYVQQPDAFADALAGLLAPIGAS